MDEKLLKELFSDEAFVASILELETAEDVQAALKKKGVELSLDEITAIQKALVNSSEEASAELSDDDLENVSGGSVTAIIGAAVAGVIALGSAVHEWTNRRW